MIKVAEQLYGKKVTDIKAYGVDQFDFSRNILGYDFSVGQFGYTVFEFGAESVYISIDGVSTIVPRKQNIRELEIDDDIKKTFVGVSLISVMYDGEKYAIQFEGLDTLYGWYENNIGLSDRAYFELEFPWI